MSFASENRERSRPTIPLASFVDILFLLLVFFLTTSAMREQERQIDLSLPEADATAGDPITGTQTVVNVDAAGKIYLGDREVSLDQLRGFFVELHSVSPNEVVVVRGDQSVNLGTAVRVFDVAYAAGLTNTSLAVVRPRADASSP